MPIVYPDDDFTSRIIRECDFPLWSTVPEGWLRRHGRTRVLVVDDQLTQRQDLFAVASNAAPLSPEERMFCEWLNVEIQFLSTPANYKYGGADAVPQGTFDNAWFQSALAEVLQDPRPVCLVLLDLLYGAEKRINEASGPKFLALLRRRLPDVPVVILSNVEETHYVRGMVKEGGRSGEGDLSFQDYLPKRITGGRGLLDRLIEKLAVWADISDPGICAFSPAMRRLARDMRRVLLMREMIPYQEGNARFPKPTVIKGMIGSGKNYVADMLHAKSARRHGPYLKADFSGHEADNFTTTLFGSGPFTGAAERFGVRVTDAAILTVPPSLATARPGVLQLASIGLLHKAHIAGEPPRSNAVPLLGTVLIDEIGTAPEVMQTRLLRVFNRGRFVPHLTSVELPTEGAIDVWFLVTVSPEGQENLREDLATRLAGGNQLDVPPLARRKEDILPLALKVLHAGADDEPARFFTEEALQELELLSETVQVRGLSNIVAGLSGVTEKLPYSGTELRQRLDAHPVKSTGRVVSTQERTTEIRSEYAVTIETTDPESVKRLKSREDALQILLAWSESRSAQFPAVLRSQDQLRGKGTTVVAGAAVAVLSFLELCLEAKCEAGRYSATRTWNFFAGVHGTKAADARTRLAPLFLLDETVSLDMLRRSDALLWLAVDVAPRRRELKALLERIRSEEAQRSRIDRLKTTAGDVDDD